MAVLLTGRWDGTHLFILTSQEIHQGGTVVVTQGRSPESLYKVYDQWAAVFGVDLHRDAVQLAYNSAKELIPGALVTDTVTGFVPVGEAL